MDSLYKRVSSVFFLIALRTYRRQKAFMLLFYFQPQKSNECNLYCVKIIKMFSFCYDFSWYRNQLIFAVAMRYFWTDGESGKMQEAKIKFLKFIKMLDNNGNPTRAVWKWISWKVLPIFHCIILPYRFPSIVCCLQIHVRLNYTFVCVSELQANFFVLQRDFLYGRKIGFVKI